MKDLNWYALTVPPQKELAAEQILRRVGYAAFVPVEPRYPRKNRYARTRDKKAEPRNFPQLPRYVFAGFDARENEGEIPLFRLSSLNVITGVVGFNGTPAKLREEAVKKLMQLSGVSIPWRAAPSPHKSFRAGDLVNVEAGIFTGQKLLPIVEIDARKAHFWLQLFGKEQLVGIPLEFLAAA